MEIRINISTLATDTLIALAADLSQQVAAQDWTADDEATALETILAHLYTGKIDDTTTMDAIDNALMLAGGSAAVIGKLISQLVMAGRIS